MTTKKSANSLHIHENSGGINFLTENIGEEIVNKVEKVQDEALKEKKEKKKARLRKRGPYRKAHANW
jgi:hypothetical protein